MVFETSTASLLSTDGLLVHSPSVQNQTARCDDTDSESEPEVDLLSCAEVVYEKRDGTQEVSYRDASSKYQWTPVVGRRRKKTPLPDYVLRRLPPHCWQELLSGIPGVVVYIDDILIREKAEADHMAALEEVLKRMENTGV